MAQSIPVITGGRKVKRQRHAVPREDGESELANGHRCGHCGVGGFATSDDLYAHMREEHDPDGIAYSEFGPK